MFRTLGNRIAGRKRKEIKNTHPTYESVVKFLSGLGKDVDVNINYWAPRKHANDTYTPTGAAEFVKNTFSPLGNTYVEITYTVYESNTESKQYLDMIKGLMVGDKRKLYASAHINFLVKKIVNDSK